MYFTMSSVRGDYKNLFETCDERLRVGDSAAALKALKKVNSRRVPRPLLAQYCSLLRRANLNENSLQILRRKIYPGLKSSAPASPREIVEYALALQRVGARRESQTLLSRVDPSVEPRVLPALASQCIFEWDYASARPYYDKAISSGKLSDYETLICRVNRLACLGHAADSGFAAEFAAVRKILIAGKYTRLLGNIMEIQAQWLINLGQWAEATAALKDAEKFLKEEGSYGHLFVKKWTAIATGVHKKDLAPLDKLRQLALKDSEWETLRHVDLYRALIAPEGIWTDWVYYGTPHPAFRATMERRMDFADEKWVGREANPKLRIDPWFLDRVEHGEICHRLLVFLLRDFYRPFGVGEIASELFSQSAFDLESSKNRVHKLVQRFRHWLSDHRLPFRLERRGALYSVRFAPGVAALCRKRTLAVSKSEFVFGRYSGARGSAKNIEDWVQILGVNPSKTRLLLTAGIEDGVIEKVGQSRYTTYALKKNI